MSSNRHEGVSCDACMRNNFPGRRFKCLVCFDFDLCAECYENGHVGRDQHSPDHPVQCILTRQDFDMYYGGEAASHDQPQSLACPFCHTQGLTVIQMHEHVVNEHSHVAVDVACPVCAAQPHGEANRMTEDLAGHLTMYHINGRDRSGEEPSVRSGRRPPQTARRGGGVAVGRGRMGPSIAEIAAQGAIPHPNPSVIANNADPIAELMRQLGGIRRSNGSGYSSTLAHIQHLHQQFGRVNLARRGRWAATRVTAAPPDLTYTQGSTPFEDQLFEIAPSSRVSSNQQPMLIPTEQTCKSGSSLPKALPPSLQAAKPVTHDNSQPLLKKLFETSQQKCAEPEEATLRRAFVQEMLLSSLREQVPQQVINKIMLTKEAAQKAEYEAGGARPKTKMDGHKTKRRQAVVAPNVQKTMTAVASHETGAVSVNVGFVTPVVSTYRPIAQVPPSTLSVAVQSSRPVTAQITASVTLAPISLAETHTNTGI